jgi:predicted secreted acid phosphatase
MDEKKRKRKPKAIILDADDTIFNFLGGICKIHNKRNGTCITPQDLTAWDFGATEMKDARGNSVNGTELRQTWKDYEDSGLYACLSLIGDAAFALHLMKDLGYKIIILTARPEKYGKDTELNLIFNNIHQYVDEIYFNSDKVKKIKELSKTYNVVMFADDRATTVQDIYENCKVRNVILIEKAHNSDAEVDPEIHRVKDLMETIRLLKDYSKE